jgi:hypothetical protein
MITNKNGELKSKLKLNNQISYIITKVDTSDESNENKTLDLSTNTDALKRQLAKIRQSEAIFQATTTTTTTTTKSDLLFSNYKSKPKNRGENDIENFYNRFHSQSSQNEKEGDDDKEQKSNLKVFPQYSNITIMNSHQLNCIYSGQDYFKINLIWLKNETVLNVSERMNDHYYILNVRQNNTQMCILKFAHLLSSDEGIYKCVAIDSKTKIFSKFNASLYLKVNLGKSLKIKKFQQNK